MIRTIFNSQQPIAIWSETGIKNGEHYTHRQYLIINDGGRRQAGYKSITRDCVCRAISIATGKPYKEVHAALNERGKSERTGKRKRGRSNAEKGVYKQTTRKYMESIGWEWTPTMKIGSGCTVHLRGDELPWGRLVVEVSRHTVAVINGVIHDTYDSSRRGTRCVYGYYQKKQNL